jgi:hypothetical protein
MKDGQAKAPGKYPTGPIRQHKALATGASLAKANLADKNPTGWGPGGIGKGGTISSTGDTGGPRGKQVPKGPMTSY